MTVLSDQSILNRQGMISPFSPKKVVVNGKSYGLSAAGYDVRVDLGEGPKPLLMMSAKRASHLSHYGYLAKTFTLAATQERFTMPPNVIGFVHDKSSWARKGLTVQNTVIEPGWRGYLTLELTYHGDEEIIIQDGDPIAQIVFHYLDAVTTQPYDGKYQDQAPGPQQAIDEC